MGRGTEREERGTYIGRSVPERRERESKIRIMFRNARNGNLNQNYVPERNGTGNGGAFLGFPNFYRKFLVIF